MAILYEQIEEFLRWTTTKSKMIFTPRLGKTFPILSNCIYWADLGINVGSEQNKYRPVLVTRSYVNSPICTIIPLTTQHLNDNYTYHIDLEEINSTVLVEQMRVIDKIRIDKPMYKKQKFAKITYNDWQVINRQIEVNYLLQPL